MSERVSRLGAVCMGPASCQRLELSKQFDED